MNYNQIKKLDENSLEQLKEGKGPVDECICHLISPPDEDRKSIRSSIRRAFAGFSKAAEGKKRKAAYGQQQVNIPITYSKGEAGKIYTTREVIKRKGSCGKCGCDSSNVTLKHSYANIRITTPDISSFCPCPSNCIPAEKQKMLNNIKVTVEQVSNVIVDPDSENSETSVSIESIISEPSLTAKKSLSSLINAQYDTDESRLY
ncbi:unnamed protein product [Arctia plantaginis]|uniref:Uncharacterized protein n=1 Tax=Arctia plantaginis TaxID=874455 RepID=A0A8S0YWV3_ARCPL|nr:unnamed protein product [Arctia plantaginis]